MRAELHSHTHYSHQSKVFFDGTCSPEDMVKAASRLGLGALGVTDHDSIEGVKKAQKLQKKYNILIIPGEEVTTVDGHCLALGTEEFIPPGKTVEETIDRIHQQGGIAVSPHPFDIKHDGLWEKAIHCDAVEAFNALNLERIANNRAIKFSKRHKIPGTAGSDAHHTSTIGYGTIEADANSVDSILKAIKRGRFVVVANYPSVKTIMNYAVLRLKLSHDYTYNYIENNYSFPKKQIAKKLLGTVNSSPGKIDYLFKSMAYVCFAGILAYSIARYAIKK